MLGADDAEATGAAIFVGLGGEQANQSSATEYETFRGEYESAKITAVCRVALFDSPAACRAALAKYSMSIELPLANALEVVGGYEIKVKFLGCALSCISTFTIFSKMKFIISMMQCSLGIVFFGGDSARFYSFNLGTLLSLSVSLCLQNLLLNALDESIKKGDVATAQFLLGAGADVAGVGDIKDLKHILPIKFANNSIFLELLEHHTHVLEVIEEDPKALLSAVRAHWETLRTNAPEALTPMVALSLRPYHFDPSFLWAPRAARNAVFSWARNVYTAQQAAMDKLFAEIPDDCAGDVLEYLEMSMPRTESFEVAAHGSSPEARAWVRAIVASAVVVRFVTFSCFFRETTCISVLWVQSSLQYIVLGYLISDKNSS